MRRISLAFAVALALPALAAGATKSVTLALVAYSTPKDAYAKLIPAFEKTAAGAGVEFAQSYGASGDQERAVAAGLPADIVNLSLAPDVDRSRQAGRAGGDAEPVHLGRRAVEHDGRVWRRAARRQDAEAGDRVPEDALPQARSRAAVERTR